MPYDLSVIEDIQLRNLLAQRDPAAPVGMLNMLKFRDRADYGLDHGAPACSGENAYARYARLVRPILDSMGAKVILTGAVWLAGPAEEWDRVFLVKYKTGFDAITLGNNPAYQIALPHRMAALAEGRVCMMDFDSSGFR